MNILSFCTDFSLLLRYRHRLILEATLLDGHHRYDICTRLGIPYKTTELAFDSREDALIWVIRNQFGRRNISTFARSELALKMKDIFTAKAKVNLQMSGGDKKSESYQESPFQNSGNPIRTEMEISKIANVSHDTVHKVDTILSKGSERLVEAARSGDISINAAKEINPAQV